MVSGIDPCVRDAGREHAGVVPMLTGVVCSAEEAQKSVSGMTETAIHAKYIELVRPPLLR